MTKRDKERAEALENMRDALTACGPKGKATLEIRWVGGGPTPYGRTDYYDLRVWRVREGRPYPAEWLSYNAARALGYRFNKRREAISVSGCGFSKSYQLATELAHLAGHPLRIEGDSCLSWVGK